MFCPSCGAQLPDDAQFCSKCGKPTGVRAAGAAGPAATGGAAPAAPAASTVGPPEAKQLKCPSCGAPINPVFGEMVITCEYCGGSVSLGGAGWKEISKHTMLVPKLVRAADALQVVRSEMDQGLFHRHAFEDSTVADQRLTFVPFWIVPASATTTYQYQDAAVGIGGTVATVAGSAMLGSMLGGGGRRGGGIAVIPIMAAPPVNPTRSDTLSQNYEYPVVAVKGMTEYQPREYAFALVERTFFDKKQVPNGAPVLNGDLSEDAAQHAAKSYVAQLQADRAHKAHHMVSKLETNVEVSEGELLHVPIWYFQIDRKGQRASILVDAHSGRIIRTVDQ